MPWDPADLPNVSNKIIAITGATSGIGYYAARTLAHQGAKIVLLCRNVDKMANIANSITTEKTSDITQLQCDVSDLESVRSCAEAFKNTGIPRIDALILNAGVFPHEFERSAQGLELTFATNHLGHWLLTGLLLEYIKDVPESRIIVVSSLAHAQIKDIDYELVKGQPKDGVGSLKRYAASKLANHWMAVSLNRRLEQANAKTVVVAAHPGASSTDLTGPSPPLYIRFLKFMLIPFIQSAEQGSWPLLMAVTDPNLSKNCYYGPKNWFETSGPPISNAKKSAEVDNLESLRLSERLWAASEELCSYKYII